VILCSLPPNKDLPCFNSDEKLKISKCCRGCLRHPFGQCCVLHPKIRVTQAGREEAFIFTAPPLLRSRPHPLSIHKAPPFSVWKQPLSALCPKTCIQPQGKLTFPIFSLTQNVLLLPTPPEQHTVSSLGGSAAIWISLDAGREEHLDLLRTAPVSGTSVTIHPQMPEEDAEKSRTGCCGISVLKSWNMEVYIFCKGFFSM